MERTLMYPSSWNRQDREPPTIGNDTHEGKSIVRTFVPWLACVALLAITGLFINLVGGGLEDDPRRALFGPMSIALFAVTGAMGVFLASLTGFPVGWDARVDHRVRFLYPASLGVVLGIVSVALEVVTSGISFFLDTTGMERFNAPLPGSVLFYSAGAVVLEVVYRLLPIPLVLWIASKFGLPVRHRLKFFWVLAAVTSLLEPFGQTMMAFAAGRPDIAISQFVLSFFFNLSQAYWFLVGGFLSSLNVRLGHYAMWHVLYGGAICMC